MFLFSVFGIAFCIGAFMSGKMLLETQAADNAYDDLRLSRQAATVTVSTANTNDGMNTDRTYESAIAPLETSVSDATTEVVLQHVKSMDFSPLQEINTDIKGWLFAEGTNIDYPVLQTDNNSYYLNHLYRGAANSSGSLFLDYRNTGLFTERNTVIYGHHMKNGTMFGALESYKQQDFYDIYPTIQLYTPEGDYLIELICGTVEDGNYEFVQFDFADEDAFTGYLEKFRARSTFQSNVELKPGDRIISLCTCSYEWNNARYMVIGRLVPVMIDNENWY